MDKQDITVELTAKDLFEFNMFHSYTHSQGIVSVIAGLCAFVLAVMERGKITPGMFLVYIIMGVIILGYIPCTLILRSRMSVKKGGAFEKPVYISIAEDGVGIRVDENENFIAWKDVYCIKDRRNQLLIYTGRITALIIPKRCISEDVVTKVRSYFDSHSEE